MTFQRSFLSVAATILAAGSSFAADAKTKITFDQHVAPILTQHCMGCHKGENGKGGLDLSTYAKAMEGGASGIVVKPGDADASRLWRLTAHKEQPYMPPKLPEIAKEQLDLMALWITQGALENSGSKPVAVKPKAEVGLMSVKRGKPDVVPMPTKPLSKVAVVSTIKANAVIAMAASPWAPLLAVGGQKQVLLYHGDTLELLGILPFTHGTPTTLKFSRNGSLLLAGGGRGGQAGKVVVYDIKTGEQIIEVGNEQDAVLAADISADQQLIALGGPSKMVRLYSTKDGTLVTEMKKHTDWIYAVEFSPDGVLLATADRAGGLVVWESATGREFYNLRGHTAAVLDVSWRDDSNVLASCGEDTTIKLWEMENGNQIKTWGAHAAGAQAVKFAHDNRLVSTGRDKVAKVWDMNGVNTKAMPATVELGLRAAFSHDGTKVYAGDWAGSVIAYAAADAKVLVQATTNPPAAPVRTLDIATKEMTAKQAEFDANTKAAADAAVKLQAATVDATPALRLTTDAANVSTAAQAQAAALKANVDKAQAGLAPAQAKALAADVKAKALVEAAAKIMAAAVANKTNAELQAAAAASKVEGDKAAAESAAAVKAVADLTAAFNAASAAYAPAAQNAVTAAAAAKLAADIYAPKAQAVAATQAAMTATKAAADKSTVELTALKAEVEKLKAVAVVPPKTPAVVPPVAPPVAPPAKK